MAERPNMIPIDHNKPRVDPLGLNVPPKTPAQVVQEHRASKEPMFPKPSGDMHQAEGYSKNEVAQRAMPSYLHKQLMNLGGYSPNPELRDKANKTIRQQQEKDSEEMGGSHWSKEDIAKVEAGRDEDLQKLDERENLIGDDNPAQEIFGRAIKGQTSRVDQQSHDSHRAGNGPNWEPKTAPGLIMGSEAPGGMRGGMKGGPGPVGGAIAATSFLTQVHKWLKKDPPPVKAPPAKVPTKPVEPVEPAPVEPTPVEPAPNPKKDAYERIKKEKKERKERREREDKEKEPKPVEPVPEPKPVEPKPLEPLPPIKLPPRPVPPVPNPYKPNVPRTPNPFKPNGPKNPQPYKPQEPAVPNPFVEPKPVTKPTPKPTIPDRRVDPVPEPVPPVPVPDPIPKPPVPVPKPKEDTTSTTETENKKSEGPHTETETETQTKLEQETNPPPKKVETGEKEPKPASPQNIPALMMPQGHVQSFPSIITGIPTHSAPSFEKTHLEINYYTELGF